jgi:hypothetical protein
MTEWLDLDTDGSLIIDWEEVFFQSNEYDLGDRRFDSCLGKLVALVQKEAFEKGLKAGTDPDFPISRLLLETGGSA